MRDCLERVWQLGTLQFDPSLPKRLGATYIDKSGERAHPIMLHRAIFGSLERFIGILLEHYADGLPLWLAPIQVVIMNITDKFAKYAQEIAKNLQKDGFRVNLDLRNEKIGYKIREHSISRVPYFVVVGQREQENNAVAVRTHSGDDLGSMSLEAFGQHLAKESDTRKVSKKEEENN